MVGCFPWKRNKAGLRGYAQFCNSFQVEAISTLECNTYVKCMSQHALRVPSEVSGSFNRPFGDQETVAGIWDRPFHTYLLLSSGVSRRSEICSALHDPRSAVGSS